MYNGLKYALVFSLGAAAGVAVSWKYMENKYNQLMHGEVKALEDYYEAILAEKDGKQAKTEDQPESEPEKEEDPTEEEVNNSFVQMYSGEQTESKQEGGSDSVDDEPRIIEPEEFGTLDNYDTETLTYYADGVTADDHDEPIENVKALLGIDPKDHFGEYDDYAVHVRNPHRQTDFEILVDFRRYYDKYPEEAADYTPED